MKVISIFEVYDTDSDGVTLDGYRVVIGNPLHTLDDKWKFYKRLGNVMKFVKSFPDGTAVFFPNGNLVILPIDNKGE